MDAMHEMLYEELRQSEQEVLHSLEKKNHDQQLTLIFEEELADIRSAIDKVKNGNFGLCEISGELIPGELLKLVPTLKSLNDFSNLEIYYRKPLHF
jgi:RNA polymerase-binding transcription factor DksA